MRSNMGKILQKGILDVKLKVSQRREREGVEVVLKKEGKPAILLTLPVT